MKLAAMFGSSSSAIGAAAVGAVVVIAGAVGITVFNTDPEAPTPEASQPVAAVEPVEATPETAPDDVAEATPEPMPTLQAPQLDLVRVDADGTAVIAGQTSPDLPIAILLDGSVIAEARADGAGDFVAILTLVPSDAPRQLSVEARPEGAPVLAGVETILVAPFAGPPVAIAAAAEDTAAPDAAEPAAELAQDVADVTPVDEDTSPTPTIEVASAPEPEPEPESVEPQADIDTATEVAAATPTPTPEVSVSQPEAPGVLAVPPASLAAPSIANAPATVAPDTRPAAVQPTRAAAPAVVIAGPEGLRVVQGSTPEPAVQTSVQLDAISYNAQGAVILAGRGPVAADIQVFLNNQPIQLGEVGPGGDWSLQLPDVDPGTYTLAVAEIARDGSTASRVETPFLREDPVRVAEAPQVEAAGIDVITVQPGFTLWGIAENTFGEGILYVQIFEENRDQIRDPNWIFPGQIFRLPDGDTVNSDN